MRVHDVGLGGADIGGTHREVRLVHGPHEAARVGVLLVGDLEQVAEQRPVQRVQRRRLELHVNGRRVVLEPRDAWLGRLTGS